MANTYSVFIRTWWRKAEPGDGEWPDNLVPAPGDKEYNDTHDPGRYSLKMEYEQD